MCCSSRQRTISLVLFEQRINAENIFICSIQQSVHENEHSLLTYICPYCILWGLLFTPHFTYPSLRYQYSNKSHISFVTFYFSSALATKDAREGAQTSIFLSASRNIAKRNAGGYYDNSKLSSTIASADDEKLQSWLWTESEKLTGVNMIFKLSLNIIKSSDKFRK